MNLSVIQIAWFTLTLFVTSIVADFNTCSERYDGYSYYYECYQKTITCNNVTANLLLTSTTDCSYCIELSVTNSNLSSISNFSFLTRSFCSLISITLSNCQIEAITEDSFSEFSKTQTLNLDGNKIKNLEFLDSLVNLKYFSCQYNELSQVSAQNFELLPNLKILNIAHNNLLTIGNTSYTLGVLEEFYLNNNNISVIQEKVFQKLSVLKILDLSENKIELIDGHMFNSLNNLQTLYLQHNRIKSIAPYSFIVLYHLTSFNLSGNGFLNEIADNTFFGCKNLKFLDLSYSNISSIRAQSFPEGISFEYLDLSNNNINSTLSFHSFPITKLNLENNPLLTLQSSEIFSRVTEFLDLSGTNVTLLSESFLPIKELDELKLTNTNLSIISPHAFRHVNIRKILNLSHNKIEVLESFTFAGLKNLQYLDLSYNPIKLIYEMAFQDLPQLSTLRISGSNLTVGVDSFNSISMPNLQHLSFIEGQQLNLKSWSFNDLKGLQFSYTTIRNLGTRVFYGLKYIPTFTSCNHFHEGDSINLCNASLKSIESNTFKGTKPTIINYDFSYNNLTHLTASTFQDMVEVNLLQLNHNNISLIDSFAFHKIDFCKNDLAYKRYNYNFGYWENTNCVNRSIYLNDMKNIQLLISKNAFSNIYNLRSLHLERSNVTILESNAFDTIIFYNNYKANYGFLYLNMNNIGTIYSNTFKNISNIIELHLDHSKIKTIQSNAFVLVTFCDGYKIDVNSRNEVTNALYLNDNLIENLSIDTFKGIYNLRQLHLENNKIKRIQKSAFYGLHMHPDFVSNTLNLSDNKITQLLEGTFNGILNLGDLVITHNNINSIEPKAFSALINLEFLDLSYNNLTAIHPNMFELNALHTLYLDGNKIRILTPESFTGLANLTHLSLVQNLIEDFPPGTLKNFPLLKFLILSGNRLSKFKIGSFSNLAELTYLDLSDNNFKIVDESILYPLHKLESLLLDNNMLSSINYTSLLDHLPTLKYISIHSNIWNCKPLINMLKSFKMRHVKYLSTETEIYTMENIDGIPCSDTEESTTADIIVPGHSEYSPELLHKLSNFIQNSDYNIKELVSDVKTLINETKVIAAVNENMSAKLLLETQKLVNISNEKSTKIKLPIDNNSLNLEFLKENSEKLLDEMRTFVNISSSKNNVIKQNPSNNSELLAEVRLLVNLSQQRNSNESFTNMYSMLKHLIESNQESRNYSIPDLSTQKLVDRLTDNSHSHSPDYTAALYLMLLVSIGIFCLLGLIAYKTYFKSKLNRNQSQRSELELINSN